MAAQLVCKNCQAPLTPSTTFCRGCNTPFPETIEIEEDHDLPPLPPHLRKSNETPEEKSIDHQQAEQESSVEDEKEAPSTDVPEEQSSISSVDSTESPEKPKPKEERKPETPSPPPTPAGELLVFNNPKLQDIQGGSSTLGSSSRLVSSAQIIASVAEESSHSRENAAKVTDGFWDYVANVDEHYRKSKKAYSLTIPHFGTFHYKFKKRKGVLKCRLIFRSSATSAAKSRAGRLLSSDWVNQWSGKTNGLSIRRKISVYIAEKSGIPLREVDEILNRILRRARELCEDGRTIHWARRGTMGPCRLLDAQSIWYGNPFVGERVQIQVGRNAITGEKSRIDEENHFFFSASKGYLKRLNITEPKREQSSVTGTSSTKGKTQKTSKSDTDGQTSKNPKKFCSGCLVALVIFLILSFWISQHSSTQEEAYATEETGVDSVDWTHLEAVTLSRDWKPPKSYSGNGRGIETKIRFQNFSDESVILHWVNFDGELEYWGNLNPGKSLLQGTYTGHVWQISNRKRKPLLYFVADRNWGIATIGPNRIDQERPE